MELDNQARKRISKFLSFVLRHKPEAAGITLSPEGWIDIDLLIKGCCSNGQPITREILEEIVTTNPKKRFSFSEDGQRIRANQGHSVDVNLGYKPAMPPELLYHGTVERFLQAIKTGGLRRMKRHHVHLSPDIATARNVGGRRGKPVILVIRAGEMHHDGYIFSISANGVWLTDHVPAQYIDFGVPVE